MIYLTIALLILSADLIIKSKVVEMPLMSFPLEKLGGKVRIIRTYNEGMAYNFMDSNPETVRKISSIVLLLFTVLSFPMIFSRRTRVVRKLGIALIIGGASSNVADRLIRGKVVDYIQFNLGRQDRISKMTYNIADFCVVAGAVLYGIGRNRKKPSRKR